MAGHGLAKGHALGDGGADVVCRQVVHQVIFQQQRYQSEAAHQVAGQRQDRVADQVRRLAEKILLRKLHRNEAAHGEPLQPHREVQQQQRTQCVAGYRIADKYEQRGDVIHHRAVADGLQHPERDTDRIGDDQRCQAVIQ